MGCSSVLVQLRPFDRKKEMLKQFELCSNGFLRCLALIYEAVRATNWKMSVVSLCYVRLITVCHAKMAAERGNLHIKSLDGLTTRHSG